MTKRSKNAEHNPEAVLESARRGDESALEKLVRAIKDPVYGLALRTLGEPSDAEDATQEILFKVVTRLDSFRGDSRFTTWVYAVAANHLRTMRAGSRERRQLSFEQMTELEARMLPNSKLPDVERTVLAREIRLICLYGVLIGLDRNHRLAYVLGEVLELNGVEGAQVLGIGPETFRKRLSRARQRIRAFMVQHYGLVRPDNRCSYELRCDPGLEAVDRPMQAGPPAGGDQGGLGERLKDLDELRRVRALFRSLPRYRASKRLVDDLTRLLAVA